VAALVSVTAINKKRRALDEILVEERRGSAWLIVFSGRFSNLTLIRCIQRFAESLGGDVGSLVRTKLPRRAPSCLPGLFIVDTRSARKRTPHIHRGDIRSESERL
jgi:hypothetical protein